MGNEGSMPQGAVEDEFDQQARAPPSSSNPPFPPVGSSSSSSARSPSRSHLHQQQQLPQQQQQKTGGRLVNAFRRGHNHNNHHQSDRTADAVYPPSDVDGLLVTPEFYQQQQQQEQQPYYPGPEPPTQPQVQHHQQQLYEQQQQQPPYYPGQTHPQQVQNARAHVYPMSPPPQQQQQQPQQLHHHQQPNHLPPPDAGVIYNQNTSNPPPKKGINFRGQGRALVNSMKNLRLVGSGSRQQQQQATNVNVNDWETRWDEDEDDDEEEEDENDQKYHSDFQQQQHHPQPHDMPPQGMPGGHHGAVGQMPIHHNQNNMPMGSPPPHSQHTPMSPGVQLPKAHLVTATPETPQPHPLLQQHQQHPHQIYHQTVPGHASPHMVIAEEGDVADQQDGVEWDTGLVLAQQQQDYEKPNVQMFLPLLRVLGKGSFGKVVLVQKRVGKEQGQLFAMKILRKSHLVRRRQIERTRTERKVLSVVNHPFIMKLHYAFQQPDKLYLVLDYCPGGELFFHLSRFRRFPERVARFYAAELLLALGHLHKRGIIYRDLKPENVLLDADGHVKLGDFGLAKAGIQHPCEGATSMCGTPEYMAPEVLAQQGHGFCVDYWGLGMLTYEMMTGLPPWYTTDRTRLFRRLKSAPLDIPTYFSQASATCVSALLERNPRRRLGVTGIRAAMEHEFFRSISWRALYGRRVEAPIRPCEGWSQPTESNHSNDTQSPSGHGSTITNMNGSDSPYDLDAATANFDNTFTRMPVESEGHPDGDQEEEEMEELHENTFVGFTFDETETDDNNNTENNNDNKHRQRTHHAVHEVPPPGSTSATATNNNASTTTQNGSTTPFPHAGHHID